MKSAVAVILLTFVMLSIDLLITNSFLNLKIPKVQAESLQVAAATPIPISSPSPTPSPSPSPVYTGFCLNVPILMYHHIQPQDLAEEKGQTNFTVDPQTFDAQMNYLVTHGYTPISANELALALKNRSQLPPKSIAITLDDGYQDAFTYAYPIFKKYNIKANLMISTGLIENPDYLAWNQLREMVGSGLVFAHNHTWSHANLAGVSFEKLAYEVNTAQNQLKQYLGTASSVFAYPYGTVNNTVINFLTQSGFTSAVSTISGTTQCDSFIMSLHRTRIGNSHLSSYGL